MNLLLGRVRVLLFSQRLTNGRIIGGMDDLNGFFRSMVIKPATDVLKSGTKLMALNKKRLFYANRKI